MNAPAHAPGDPVGAIVLGGYLGAGKTSLVNHLLRHAQGLRIAVLVNDFGEVSIDADLILGAQDGVLDLAGGCMCCSIGSDLSYALDKVLARRPGPDLLLIECSGVGMPRLVAQSVALRPDIRIRGIVVLADAPRVLGQMADPYVGDTVSGQLEQADLVILNKADLLAGADMGALQRDLAGRFGRARFVPAEHGAVPASLLLGVEHEPEHGPLAGGAQGSGPGLLQPRPIGRASPPPAAALFESLALPVEHPVDVQRLALDLTTAHTGVVRAKGFLRGPDGRLHLLQSVGSRFQVDAWLGPAPAHAGLLVCIGLRGQVDAAGLRTSIAQAGEPALTPLQAFDTLARPQHPPPANPR